MSVRGLTLPLLPEAYRETSRSPAAPVISGSFGPQASDRPYLIVPETSTPHATWDTAQPLPDVSYFGVVGTLQAGEAVDLYRISADPAQPTLHFVVKIQEPANGAGESVFLVDAAGKVLSFQPIVGQGSPTAVEVSMTLTQSSGAVFLGIGRLTSDASLSPQPAIAYQVWVDRDAEPGSSAGSAGPGPSAPGVSRTVVLILDPPSSRGTPQAAHDRPGEAASVPAGAVSAPLLVASGALPTRSAAPSGGVLGFGELTPTVDRLPTAAESLSATDPEQQRATEPPVGREAAPSAVGEARTPEPANLVVLHGPGGYPLLGTASTDSWSGRDPSRPPVREISLTVASPEADDHPSTDEEPSAPRSSLPSLGGSLLGALSLGYLLSRSDESPRLASAWSRLARRSIRGAGRPGKGIRPSASR